MAILPAELLFSMGRLAAVLSLLFIVILILTIIFLLFFHQRNACEYDEHELPSETDPTLTENKHFELANFRQYLSTDKNQTTSINSVNSNIDEHITRSTTNLVSSSE